MVACEQQTRISHIGNRPLRVIIERPETIHLEVDVFERSWRSTLERALLESAMRVDLIGGVDRLAEALANGASVADPQRISQLARELGHRGLAGERRLASLAHALDLPLHLNPEVGPRQPVIHLDPRDERSAWSDSVFRVKWNVSIDELRSVIDN
jgi:predicted transcriptional regulator of viral defense system